ncbi:MAG: PRC-barrel domain-containing protein [Verrucomicrobiales bacterium]|nr:PRC-barrel domain-containing protein [Verrucomicrobiales bacterium]
MKKSIITSLALAGLLLPVHGDDTKTKDREQVDKVAETHVDHTDKVKKTPTRRSLEAASLQSAEVFNMQGEEVGNIHQLLVNPKSGKIGHAIVSVGGFLGIGDRLVAVPWKEIKVMDVWEMDENYDAKASDDAVEENEEKEVDYAKATLRVYIDTDKTRLEKAPVFDADTADKFDDEENINAIDTYWEGYRTVKTTDKEPEAAVTE